MSTEINIDDYRHDKGSVNNYTMVTMFYNNENMGSGEEIVGTYENSKDMVSIIRDRVKSYESKGINIVQLVDFKAVPKNYDDGYSVLKINFTFKGMQIGSMDVIFVGLIFKIYSMDQSETYSISQELNTIYSRYTK